MPDFEDSLLDKGLLPFAELVSEENGLIYGPLALSTAAKVMKSHASRLYVDAHYRVIIVCCIGRKERYRQSSPLYSSTYRPSAYLRIFVLGAHSACGSILLSLLTAR